MISKRIPRGIALWWLLQSQDRPSWFKLLTVSCEAGMFFYRAHGLGLVDYNGEFLPREESR